MIPTQLILDIAKQSDERARELAVETNSQLREQSDRFLAQFREQYETLAREVAETNRQYFGDK